MCLLSLLLISGALVLWAVNFLLQIFSNSSSDDLIQENFIYNSMLNEIMRRIFFIALILSLILLSACAKEEIEKRETIETGVASDINAEAKAIVEVGVHSEGVGISVFLYHVIDKNPKIVEDAGDIIELNMINYEGSLCSLVADNVSIENGKIKVSINRTISPNCILTVRSPSIECGTATGMYYREDTENFDQKFIEISKEICPDDEEWSPILDEYFYKYLRSIRIN